MAIQAVSDHIEVPADRTAVIKLKTSRMVLWYDEDRDEVIIQLSGKGGLIVKPRAGNSVSLTEGKFSLG